MTKKSKKDSGSDSGKRLSQEHKRIQKELKLLKSLNTDQFLYGKIERENEIVIPIEIQASCVKSRFLSKDIQKLHFEVFLSDKFPFQPPQIYCKTKFCQPTIDDRRDVLEEVIQKEWEPRMTIYEAVQLIPEFVSDTLIQMKQDDEIKSIGKWHLG